jgi:Protein of unknown function (DUF3237)
MSQLRSQPLFNIQIDLHPLQEVGVTPLGQRRIAPVSGGTFEGERLRGVVLPQAGLDWLLVRADGTIQLDVRMTLQTDDGALILMSYRGVRHGSAEVTAKLARGERVERDEYYLRTVLRDCGRALRLAQQHRRHRYRRTPTKRRRVRSVRSSVNRHDAVLQHRFLFSNAPDPTGQPRAPALRRAGGRDIA